MPFEKTPIDLVHDVLVKHTKVHSSPDSLTPRPSSCPPPHSDAESPSVLTPVGRHNPIIKLQFTVVVFFFSLVRVVSDVDGRMGRWLPQLHFILYTPRQWTLKQITFPAAILSPIRSGSWNSHCHISCKIWIFQIP